MKRTRWIMLAGVAALLAAAGPALADVRAGVDAWSRGDYAAAVAEWEGPAAAGDADAMFNLAQAYRLGRGVAQDGARAEQLYYRAAQGGHLQAADTYGLMLFQAGRHAEALTYVEDAARRGDPRSQYLLGIAHFNGDNVPRDWVRAYALLTLANGAGLPQAAPAIAEMDQHIAMADRQRAAGLAVEMRAAADAARWAELAAADLGAGAPSAPAASAAPVQASVSPRVPQPVPTVAVSPSVAAARDAVAQARAATGTGSPAQAGAGYARPAAAEPRVAGAAPTPPPATVTPAAPPRPVVVAAAAPPPPPPPAPAPRATATGQWKVQLGAFSVAANADRLWASVAGLPALAGHPRRNVPTGRASRLLADGFASQADAQAACNALQRAGHDCLVTRN